MMHGMQHANHKPAAPIPPAGALLAVDPGLQRTGYAVLQRGPGGLRLCEAGLIRLSPRRPLPERLLELEHGLEEIIRAHRPVTLACEELFAHYAHPRTAVLMAHARGTVLALSARCGLSFVGVGATHAKKMLTGNGHATKTQVQRAVAALLGLARPPEPHDVADAIAIGLAGLRRAAAIVAANPGRAARRNGPAAAGRTR